MFACLSWLVLVIGGCVWFGICFVLFCVCGIFSSFFDWLICWCAYVWDWY